MAETDALDEYERFHGQVGGVDTSSFGGSTLSSTQHLTS